LRAAGKKVKLERFAVAGFSIRIQIVLFNLSIVVPGISDRGAFRLVPSNTLNIIKRKVEPTGEHLIKYLLK
jgi:hypothetical protein